MDTFVLGNKVHCATCLDREKRRKHEEEEEEARPCAK